MPLAARNRPIRVLQSAYRQEAAEKNRDDCGATYAWVPAYGADVAQIAEGCKINQRALGATPKGGRCRIRWQIYEVFI